MFKQALKVNKHHQSDLWSDGPYLCFKWIITVIKFKLIIKKSIVERRSCYSRVASK